MPMIEGIGDEVLQVLLGLVVLVLAVAAWWSTQIADRPRVRTVLILERRAGQRNSTTPAVVPREPQTFREGIRAVRQELTGELDPMGLNAIFDPFGGPPIPVSVPAEPPVEEPGSDQNSAVTQESGESSTTSDAAKTSTSGQQASAAERPLVPEASAPPGNDESPACQLRQRRLTFLENLSNRTDGRQRVPENEEIPSVGDEDDDDSPEGNIRIRLKYLNDEQKLVEGRLQEPLGDFRRRHFNLELSTNKLVRLIFNGQVLARDTASLQEHGLFDNCVVHCLVHQPRAAPAAASEPSPAAPNLGPRGPQLGEQPRQEQGNHRDWDLGSVVFMFLSLALGLAWYSRCVYSQYFTTTASVALVGLTGVFVVSVVGLMLPDHDGLRA